jgi:hypothetical protein
MKKMGRLTKRNRAKYRRRAYEAGMRRTPALMEIPAESQDEARPSSPDPAGGELRDFDGKRAA